jgi:RecA-family ATPase
MLQMGCACAAARDWLGFTVKRKCKVLYLSCEDDQDEVHFRAEQIAKAEAIPLIDLENFDAIEPEEETILAVPDHRTGRMMPTPLFLWLEEYIQANGVNLLMLDSIADVFGGDELNRSQVRGFLQLLRGRIARKLKCPVFFLAHPSVSGMRDGRGYSGVTHWNNGVRSRLYLESMKKGGEEADTDFRTLKLIKANRAKAGLEISLRWKDGRFVCESEKSSRDIVRALADEDLFLDLLDEFEASGRNVSDKPSSTYAPARFEEHPKAKERGVTKKRFSQAMNILFGAKKIKVAQEGRGSKPRSKIVRAQPTKEVPF